MLGKISGVVKKQVGTQVYYFGTVSSDKVRGITFVPVVEHSKNPYLQEDLDGGKGYQRPGSRSRMRLFMKYLRDHKSSVVPPVLLSGRGWEFEPSGDDDHYGSLIVNGPAAIMDGQHRVGGYVALFEEEAIARPIDFIVLVGLDVDREKEEFITVNTTQKGVPKPLTTFLGDEEEGRIAWMLNEEDDSPFKGRITRTTMQRQHLFALHSVAKGVKRTFNHGKLLDLDEDDKLEILCRYWTVIADERDEEWADIEKLDDEGARGRKDFEFKMLELTGFMAWSLIAPEILGRSYTENVGMNWDNVKKLVRDCGDLDWRKDGQYQGMTGEYGAGRIKQDMERKLPAEASTEDTPEGI